MPPKVRILIEKGQDVTQAQSLLDSFVAIQDLHVAPWELTRLIRQRAPERLASLV